MCQGARRELWLEDRREELLPVHYMHVVFTLLENLNPWVLGNQRDGYAALFRAAWDTLDTFDRKQVTDDAITFEWKDYKDGGKNKLMTLDGVENLIIFFFFRP